MRKIKFLTGYLFVIFAFGGLNAQNLNYSRVKIPVKQNDIKILTEKGLAIDFGIKYKDGFLTGEFSETELKILKENNFNYEVIIDDLKKFYKDRNNNSEPIVRTDKTPANFSLGSMGGNLTLSEIMTELDEMRTLYPNLISIKQPITNNYTTHDGNGIYWVRISDNPNVDEPDETEVLYNGLHHAREPVSMMQLIYIMWYMLENYENGGEIQYLVDNFEMYFIPCVNPDGYAYNQSTDPDGGGMWRKNRKNNGDGTTGVDLNRNYGFNWGYDDFGSSPTTSSETYRGTAAFSEPETQMMKEFTEAHEFQLAHNHHTYSNLLIYPWGYDNINTPEPDETLYDTYAAIMTKDNGYTPGHGWEILYPVNGDACDWMYGEQSTKNKIFAFTQETGDSFWPSSAEIIPLCEENIESNLYLTRLAGKYAEISDLTPNYVAKHGYLNFDIHFIGLDTLGTFTVSISSDAFAQSGASVQFPEFNLLEHKQDSIFYFLNEDINIGDEFTYTISVDNGIFTFSKTITKVVGKTNIIMHDPGDDLGNWTSSKWSVTNGDYHSETSSITDSETGEYINNENSAIVLTNAVDLSSYSSASVSYWAKWNIEAGWDCVQFFVSTNGGSNWTALETEHTVPGSGGVQPIGQPVYEGNSGWINETIDLSSYLTNNVKFKFLLKSDGSVTADGFYFDDFSILNLNASNTAPVITNQQNITGIINQETEIKAEDLVINDPDSNFPSDFLVIVYPGDNYTVNGSSITPSQDYTGILTVPVRVHDGFDESNIFNLSVNISLTDVDLLYNSVVISPNPAKDFFTLTMGNNNFNKIQITDCNGKIIKEISAIHSDKINVSTDVFNSGMYFIRLIGEQTIYKKLIIRR